ncbi:hypothetical protein [Enterovibrio norvegicus]|uniref:hypothetical protein n=1 Tax=Enterovibrio norvegicus TaxID=188144 RepID=UPI0018ED782D|nr:hypothetical protein [Enterovibrio norvegicus]
MDWLVNNAHWVFSGVGVPILGYLFLRKKDSGLKQIQKSGKNSKNYQAGNDINIGQDK